MNQVGNQNLPSPYSNTYNPGGCNIRTSLGEAKITNSDHKETPKMEDNMHSSRRAGGEVKIGANDDKIHIRYRDKNANSR